MIVFPVRHHSPAGAMRLAESIRAARPRLILVEGPCDATPLIPLLLAPDTRPPAAILAYLPAEALAEGEESRSSTWPFCAYSPEYVALQTGREVGADLRFFDMPAGAFMDAPKAGSPSETPPDVWQAVAARFGFDDYEEFWECRFEMADGDLREALLELGLLVREYGNDARDAAREAWMRAEIARALAEGYPLDGMFVVCGAAHAPALTPPFSPTNGGDNPSIPSAGGGDRGGARSAKLTLVPFSYPRLSEQLGYGAGNRAPAYYQMVWEHGGDFRRATQEALIRTADALHRAGYAVSLADAIEANRLATTLAALRDKPAPGLYEVRDAAHACYGRGTTAVDGVLWPLLIGEAVGAVSAHVERTALQHEFYDTVARLRLSCADAPREHRLYLTQPADVEASVFLHRLAAADIPFGHVEAVQMVGRSHAGPDVANAARWLGQLREKWTLQWTPLTDIRLVEASVEGDSLAQVCARRFRRALAGARRVADAADVLLRIVLTRLEPLYLEGLLACEATSSTDDDLPSLARAAYNLHSLVKYGASRAMATEALATLLAKVYVRASLLLPAAAAVADEAAPPLRDALITLHDVARQSPPPAGGTEGGPSSPAGGNEGGLLTARLRLTAASDSVHPLLAGLACTLLLFDGALYTEKQIIPAQLKKQPRKASYNGRLEGSIGLYPGAAPRRIKLLEVTEAPLTADDWQQALTHAERSTANLFRQFQAVAADPLATPEACAFFAPARFWVDGGEVYLLDGEGQAIALAEGWRIQSVLTRRPVAVLFGRTAVRDGVLRLTPLGLVTALPEAERVRVR